MRRPTVFAAARGGALVCVGALALAACGGGGSAHKPASHAKPVSSIVIVRAARLTARQAGYAAAIDLSFDSRGLGGEATLAGSGKFGAASSGGAIGQLHATVNLPGVLAEISPITSTAILTHSSIYVQLPQRLATLLSGEVKAWVSSPTGVLLADAGIPRSALGGELTPKGALAALARASRDGVCERVGSERTAGHDYALYREKLRDVPDLGAIDVAIDPATGLIHRLSVHYAKGAGATAAELTLTFTAFGAQQLAAPPATAQTTSLASIISQLHF